ncbi:ADP-ribosylglycohydrolase family protein [Clostridium saccharoperbutylacetonicum]|uniref:ADP-ribosylglycohydrolase family protein n=1 Tax=Clostridium saccharoperbutylacetonicum TaxID=36745 RepID=UPI0039EC437C
MNKLKLEKYIGAILGAAIGDALGWPNEQNSNNLSKPILSDKESFRKWVRMCGGKNWKHEEVIKPGEYSDDTQMIIATARSLRYKKNWSQYFSKIELPSWSVYERGGGRATKASAEILKKGVMPWDATANSINNLKKYFASGGNGVAMRILPHIFGNEEKPGDVMNQVVLNGIFTHGHPRALIGATLYADALICISNYTGILKYGELVDILLNRKNIWGEIPKIPELLMWIDNANKVTKSNYLELWNDTVNEVIALLNIAKEGLSLGALDAGNDTLEKLGCFERNNGAGTITAVISVYLFSKYASNPNLGIVEAAYLKKADTDTLASMVGGLLGMLHSNEWIIPKWCSIQDCEFLKRITKDITENYEAESIETKKLLIDDSKRSIKDQLKNIKVGDKLAFAPFNTLTLLEKIYNKTNSKNIAVNTLKFISDEGQTIFIKTFGKALILSENAIKNENTDFELNKINPKFKETQNMANDDKMNSIIITANKLRSFVNILPDNLPTDQYLLLISDIMIELERVGIRNFGDRSLYILKKRWNGFNITDVHINKIVQILLKY